MPFGFQLKLAFLNRPQKHLPIHFDNYFKGISKNSI